MSYQVLIVEDQKMPRQLLEIFVNNSEEFSLLGSVANADVALDICRENPVDLILMDVLTELGSNGLEVSRILKQENPDQKIIIMTSMPEASWLEQAKEIGVDSFWYKESDGDTIISIMKRTMDGEHIYPFGVPKIPIGQVTNHDFTDRELDILRELLTGDSNNEIGQRLGLAAGTVKWYVQQLLNKTGFKTRTELAITARSLGIVINTKKE